MVFLMGFALMMYVAAFDNEIEIKYYYDPYYYYGYYYEWYNVGNYFVV